MCLLLVPKSAECKTQVHIRKTFIPKPHDWKSVDRVAILQIEHSHRVAAVLKSLAKSAPGFEFPSDSTLRQLLGEMRRQIQMLDSSIIIVTVGKPTFELPDSELTKILGGISKADAVLSMEVVDVDYADATAEVPGGYAGDVKLPPLAAKPATARAQMTFTLKDVKYGEIIWQVDANGKDVAAVAGEGATEADPPKLETLLHEMIIAAGALLPFGEVPAE